jgi:hypothetical protein
MSTWLPPKFSEDYTSILATSFMVIYLTAPQLQKNSPLVQQFIGNVNSLAFDPPIVLGKR